MHEDELSENQVSFELCNHSYLINLITRLAAVKVQTMK